MISALDVVTAIGPSVFDVMVEGAQPRAVDDVFLAEPDAGEVGGAGEVGEVGGAGEVGEPGDLVLGVGFAAGAVGLLERCASVGSSGVVLRTTVASDSAVRETAERLGLMLAGLRPGVSWAHVVWMLRGVVDRAAAPASPDAGDAGVHNDLFVLADAAAAIVDAPVTIEDNQSRVLAYSTGQGLTDTARVSTIVGRRVPADVVAQFRASGVFRRLARSDDPFMVPGRPDGTLPRLVVPVRAGDEWLGSIWAVVEEQPADQVVAELSNAAAVLALHLLRLRAQANVARRNATERLREALRRHTPGAGSDLVLPPGPWRVVALEGPEPDADLPQQVDLWAATCRRSSWADPLLADVDGVVFAITTEGTGPGSSPWLRRLVETAYEEDPVVHAAAGGIAHTPADLPRSRVEAAEVLALVKSGDLTPPVGRFENAWPALTVARATAGVDPPTVGGPVVALMDHDRVNGTDYVATLRAWLAYPGDPRRAARALHVHPNTLRHRMRRLGETVELELADPTHRLALQLQLEALRPRAVVPS